jgi:SOS response regulatory protein OraA/RecX
MPGERYAMKSDDDGVQRPVRDPNGPLVAELVYTEAELVETSAVSVPAVPSAQIRGIRSPLEAEAERIRSPLEAATRPKEIEMSKFTNLSATPVLDRAIAETLARSGEADLRARLRGAGVTDDAIAAMFNGARRSAAQPAAPQYQQPPEGRREASVDDQIRAEGGDPAAIRRSLARDAKLTPEEIEKRLAAMTRPASAPSASSPLDAQIDAEIRAEGGDPAKVRRDLARAGFTAEAITRQLASMCGR